MKRALHTVVGAAAALALASCQSYDVDPVSPSSVEVQDQNQQVVGRPLSPAIMLVVDRSGSMEDNAAGQPQTCVSAQTSQYSGRGADCKWNNLLDVLLGAQGTSGQGFLANLDSNFTDPTDPIQLGLTNFSGSSNDPISTADACSTGQVLVNVGPNSESAISSALLQTIPAGGTPTAATLAILPPAFPGPNPSLMVQRANYAILLTDGAPNCDGNFNASASNCSGDQCTLGSCASANWGDPSMCACFEGTPSGDVVIPQGCLDQSAAVQAVASLNSGNYPIKTFVIGFGSVTTAPDATATLNQMGMAGGVALSSSSGYSFFQASSSTDLTNALNDIIGILTSKCQYNLNAPPANPGLIEVLVAQNGATPTTLSSSQWSYDASSDSITITDNNVCNEIKNSTANTPVNVTFRYATQ